MAPRSPARGPVRLEFADDLFARGHRGVGAAVVSQRVWRLDATYDADRLRRVADGLARGRLARRIRRALVPGARDSWVPADQPPVLDLERRPIRADAVTDWLLARQRDHIDPHAGPSWRLAAVDTDDGGAVVTLRVAHAIADGAAIRDALVTVATGSAPLAVPSPPTGGLRLREDALDAMAQVRAIGGWAYARRRAARDGRLPPRTSAGPLPEVRPNPAAEQWSAPLVVAEFDTAAASIAAQRQGGSTNAWFIAVAAAILDQTGHATPGDPIPVSVPVSGFEPGDHRANSTRIARVEVPREALADRDLAVVKSAAKDAYTRLGSAGPGFSPIPLPLVQMLPDAVLRRVPQPPSAACLASNNGVLPEPLVHVMGDRVRAVSTFGTYQEMTAAQARAVGGGLLAWHAAAGDRSTLTLIPAEPDRVPDAAAFGRRVVAELGSWGVDALLW